MSIQTIATFAKMGFAISILVGAVAPIMLWVERRASALMQDRRGPNRLGPLGLFQGIADAAKFIFKEDIIPTGADKGMFLLAPVLALVPALTTFLVVPFGPDLMIAGERIAMVVVPGEAGVLLFLALGSLGVYSLVCAGYASNNKYSLLGSVRASAQMISYELAMGFAVLGALIPVGSFRLDAAVAWQQEHLWAVIPQFIGFIVFLVASYAETNRLPFDLPEAESELVAGFHTEYGSMRFAMFFMGEYISMTVLSALLCTLYLGGWTLPGVTFPETWIGVAMGAGVLATKVSFFMFLYVWVRWTLPRFRYDQLMTLGWKVLLPLSMVNFLVMAALTVGGIL